MGPAGTAIVDGIAASAYTTLEEYGLVLDAAASQRFKHAVCDNAWQLGSITDPTLWLDGGMFPTT